MNGQIIIALFLIFFTVATIFLYVWKAKKTMDYQNDERWQLIQNKSNNAANCLNYVLIVLLAIGETVSTFYNVDNITFTFNRALTYGLYFIGLRNAIELFALIHFDKQL